MQKNKPEVIQEVGFDFSWDEQKVWALEFPTENFPFSELAWHLDTPFIWSKPDGYYDVNPLEVIEHPEAHPEEYQRTMAADTTHPIDIMRWRGRWVILDGLHRLMKLFIEGHEEVAVRKIPQSAIPDIITE